MNRLKGIERDLKDFETGGTISGADEFELGIRYYENLWKYIQDSLVLGNLGFCHFYYGDHDKAVAYYRRAIEQEPHFYFYYWDLGLLNYYLKDFSTAQYFFDKAIFYMPQTLEYYNSLKVQLYQNKRKDLDKYMLNCYYRLSKDEEEAYVKLAECHHFMKDYTNMLKTSLVGLKSFPKNHKLYYYAGLAYFMHQEYSAAIPFFNEAIALNPEYTLAYYYRGLSHEKQGQSFAKLIDFSKVVNLGEEDIEEPEKWMGHTKLHLNTELIVLRYFM